MTVGTLLRERREQLGYDLTEMADFLCIRLPYLEAIERESFGELPGSAYAIGFIRTYGKALGFDEEQIADDFRKEQAHTMRRPALTVPTPIVESRVPTAALLLIALALIAVVWIGWAMLHPSDRKLAETVPAVPDRLQPQPVVPATPAAAPAPVEEQEVAHNDMPAEAKPETSPFAPVPPTPAVPVPAGVPYNAEATGHLRIVASDYAWIQVRDPSYNIVFTKILHPGDSYKVAADSGYMFDTGNSGGVRIEADGVMGPPLGDTGVVIRNVPLAMPQPAATASKHP